MSTLSAGSESGFDVASDEAPLTDAIGACVSCDAMGGLVRYVLQRESMAAGYASEAQHYRNEHFVDGQPATSFDGDYVEIMLELADTAKQCADDVRDGAVIFRRGCHGPLHHNIHVNGKLARVALECRSPKRSLLEHE